LIVTVPSASTETPSPEAIFGITASNAPSGLLITAAFAAAPVAMAVW
jgi:hypothetical protein